MYVKADKLFNDEIKNYDMLVLPGGRPGGQNLLENQDVISLVQYFNEHHQGPATPYPFAFKILEVFGKDVTEMKERLMYNFAGGR